MTLTLAYATWGLTVALILAVALVGCESSDPAGPVINVNSGGNVNVNVTDGSVSPIATAPCGNQVQPITSDGPDCSSTVTPTPVVVNPQ